MGEDLGQISHFPGDGLSAIGEDLGPFAERALPARLTSARVLIDKQIDIWKVVKDKGIKQLERLGRKKKGAERPSGYERVFMAEGKLA